MQPMFAFDEEHLRFSSTESPVLEKMPTEVASPAPVSENEIMENEVVVRIQEFVANDAPNESQVSRAKKVGLDDFEIIKIVGKGAYGKARFDWSTGFWD